MKGTVKEKHFISFIFAVKGSNLVDDRVLPEAKLPYVINLELFRENMSISFYTKHSVILRQKRLWAPFNLPQIDYRLSLPIINQPALNRGWAASGSWLAHSHYSHFGRSVKLHIIYRHEIPKSLVLLYFTSNWSICASSLKLEYKRCRWCIWMWPYLWSLPGQSVTCTQIVNVLFLYLNYTLDEVVLPLNLWRGQTRCLV